MTVCLTRSWFKREAPRLAEGSLAKEMTSLDGTSDDVESKKDGGMIDSNVIEVNSLLISILFIQEC
jgi:hypothetical protein